MREVLHELFSHFNRIPVLLFWAFVACLILIAFGRPVENLAFAVLSGWLGYVEGSKDGRAYRELTTLNLRNGKALNDTPTAD